MFGAWSPSPAGSPPLTSCNQTRNIHHTSASHSQIQPRRIRWNTMQWISSACGLCFPDVDRNICKNSLSAVACHYECSASSPKAIIWGHTVKRRNSTYMVYVTRHALSDKLIFHHPSPVRIIFYVLHPFGEPADTTRNYRNTFISTMFWSTSPGDGVACRIHPGFTALLTPCMDIMLRCRAPASQTVNGGSCDAMNKQAHVLTLSEHFAGITWYGPAYSPSQRT